MGKNRNGNRYRKISIINTILILLILGGIVGLTMFLNHAKEQRELEQQALIDKSKEEERLAILEQEKLNAGLMIVVNEVIYESEDIAWLELYNPSSFNVDISGYILKGYNKSVTQYAIPNNSIIEAKSYFVIELNSTFREANDSFERIEFNGTEAILLINISGSVIESITIPKMECDESYGRKYDGEDFFCKQTSSLNMSNNNTNEKLQDSPSFSMPSGYYTKAFTLEIKAQSGKNIYYTLDGSKPSLESSIYIEPLEVGSASGEDNFFSMYSNTNIYGVSYVPTVNIDKATIIRAVTIDENGIISEESTAIYFVDIMSKAAYTNLPVISIVAEPSDLFGYMDGIYVTGRDYDEAVLQGLVNWNSANYWRDISIEASVKYFEPDSALSYEGEVRLSTDKKTSLNNAQKSLIISTMCDDEKRASSFYDYMTLTAEGNCMYLDSGGSDYLTKVRNRIVNGLITDINIEHFEYNPCVVFLNGEYWGVYNIVKKVTEESIAEKKRLKKEDIIVARLNDLYNTIETLNALETAEVLEATEALEVAEANEAIIVAETAEVSKRELAETQKIKEIEEAEKATQLFEASMKYMVTDDSEDQSYYKELFTFLLHNDPTNDESYNTLCEMVDIESLINCYSTLIYTGNAELTSSTYYMWRSIKNVGTKDCDGKWRFGLADVSESMGVSSVNTVVMNTFLSTSLSKDPLWTWLKKNEKFCTHFSTIFNKYMTDVFTESNVKIIIAELAELYSKPMEEHYRRYFKAVATDVFKGYLDSFYTFFDQRFQYMQVYSSEVFTIDR